MARISQKSSSEITTDSEKKPKAAAKIKKAETPKKAVPKKPKASVVKSAIEETAPTPKKASAAKTKATKAESLLSVETSKPDEVNPTLEKKSASKSRAEIINGLDEDRKQEIDTLLLRLRLKKPRDYKLYHHALTHSSFTYENKHNSIENYERLEYLGDAVLKLVVSQYLFERFPDYREGELTKIRAVVVSDAKLAELALQLDIGSHIVFGASEKKNGGHKKVSNLACAFEALLGALYLDGRMPELTVMLRDCLEAMVTATDLSKTKDNYKATLQELTQADGGVLPHYRTVEESGPSHSRTFIIEVSIHGEVMGIGSGKSKKEAQQSAARQALETLNELDHGE